MVKGNRYIVAIVKMASVRKERIEYLCKYESIEVIKVLIDYVEY